MVKPIVSNENVEKLLKAFKLDPRYPEKMLIGTIFSSKDNKQKIVIPKNQESSTDITIITPEEVLKLNKKYVSDENKFLGMVFYCPVTAKNFFKKETKEEVIEDAYTNYFVIAIDNELNMSSLSD